MNDILNKSQWVPQKFWNAFVGDVQHLLHNTTPVVARSLKDVVETSTDKSLADGEMDDELWAQPWLFCQQGAKVCKTSTTDGIVEDVCENAPTSEMKCEGTMDKADWLNPAKRTQQTIAAFKQLESKSDLMQEMNVCDLDEDLGDFCQAMATARSKVVDANCLASGKCFQELFFYQPSLFSVSNNKFVRQTVEAFYDETSPDVCAKHTSLQSKALRDQNGKLAEKCGARFVNDIMKVVRLARLFVGGIVRSGYFMGMILLHSVRMIMPAGNHDSIIEDIRTYFDLLMEEIADMVSALGEVVVEMIMDDTELGKWLQSLIKLLCMFRNWVHDVFYLGIFCPIRLGIIDILDAVIPLFVFGVPAGVMEFRVALERGSCHPRDTEETSCQIIFMKNKGAVDRVDAATRCWSSYVNSLGDSLSLSCSAADSCLYDGASSVDGLIVCDSCPAAFASDFSQYNCDTVRKQCKCGVQKITRSACINHAQCTTNTDLPATCDMLDTSLEILPYATAPCNTCVSNALCIEATGGARCTCANRHDSFASCSVNERGNSIVPEQGGLCLVTLGESASDDAARSMGYSMNYGDLAAAPCNYLDSAQTFCMLVRISSGTFSHYVVGLQAHKFGPRRLLSDSNTKEKPRRQRGHNHISSFDLQQVALEPWQYVLDTGCRMVAQQVQQNNDYHNITADVSVSDTVLYTSCLRWRAIGEDVKLTYNLSVNNTFLLSTQDLTAAFSDISLFFKLVRHPGMFVYIFLHTEAAAPVRAVVRSARIWVYHHIAWMKDQAQSIKLMLRSNGTNDHNTSDWFLNFTNSSKLPRQLYTAHKLRNELMQSGSPVLASPIIKDVLRQTEDFRAEETDELSAWVDEAIETIEDESEIKNPLHAINRRLLIFQDSMDAVKEYSIQLSLGDGATQLLGSKLADDFSELPLAYPPISLNWDQKAECAAGTQLWSVVSECAYVFYTYFAAVKPGVLNNTIERSIFNSFPNFTTLIAKSPSSVDEQQSFAAQISHTVFQKIMQISPAAIQRRMIQLPGVLKKVLVCDVNTVMFCSEFRYSLFSSAVVVAVLTYAVALVLSTIGVPYVWTIAAFIYIPLVFFYSFGISPLCFPMIPTCLGDEILKFLDLIIPQKVSWPQPLQRTVGCVNNPDIPAADCIVTCEETPFLYMDWMEPLAWGLCDISLSSCTAVETWLSNSSLMQGIYVMKKTTEALDRSAQVIRSEDEEMKSAFRICASLTSWRSIPVLLLIGLSFYIIPVLVMLPVQLIISSFRLGISSVLFSHLRWGELEYQ